VAALTPPASAHPPAADPALWERRLAAYRRLAARAAEAAESGWFRAANDRFYRECAEIEARFSGKDAAAQSEEASALRKAAFRRVDRAEDIYWRRCTVPMQDAAVTLALTPAPNLAAICSKIAVMRAHELDELEAMPRPMLELLDDDVARLM
jgi:hypothetical protein